MSKMMSVARNARGSKARLLAASSAGAVALALALGGTATAAETVTVVQTLDLTRVCYTCGYVNVPNGAPADAFTSPFEVDLAVGDTLDLTINFAGTEQLTATGIYTAFPSIWTKNLAQGSQITQSGYLSFLDADGTAIYTAPYIDSQVDGSVHAGAYVTNFAGIPSSLTFSGIRWVGQVLAYNGVYTTRTYDTPTFYVGANTYSLSGLAAAPLCELLSSGADTCAIDASSVISGTADALGGADTIQLGGASDFSFNADAVGSNFLNFEQVTKTGTSSVTLTGSAEMPVYVDEGTLAVAGTVTGDNANSAVIVRGDGAQVQVLAGGTVDGGSNYSGVYVTAADADVSNAGTISGYFGAYLEHDGSVTNLAGGVIDSTSNTVVIRGAGEVTNAGTITSDGVAGFNYPTVYIGGGGTVTNQAGGLIVGGTTSDAVSINGGAGTVTNDGAIQGGGNGVYFGAAGTLTNHGTISGSAANGVFLTHGGTVTNTGSITSNSTRGVQIQTGEGTLINSGTISGSAFGARLYNGGTVTNQAGGVISGAVGLSGGSGVANVNQPLNDVHALTVTNAGTITGSSGVGGAGVRLEAGGTVDNQSGGVIEGATGLDAWAGILTLTNAGTIRSTASGGYTAQAVYVGAGGTVTNLSGGVIDGGVASAIYVSSGEFLLTNSGSIVSGGDAVFVAGAGTVDNRAGGYISGDSHGVSMGGATTVTNAGTIASMLGGAIYANGVGDVTNSGTITGSTQGVVLHAGGSVDNQTGGWIGGQTAIDSSAAALTLTNAGTIAGGGSGYTAVLTNGGSVTNAAGGLIASQNSIYNNGAGDLTVDNAGVLNGQVATAGTGVLTLTNRATGEIYGQYSAVDSQGGRIDVDNAGLIQGGSWGVVGRNADDRILNSGTIKGVGQDGVTLAAGGELTNTGLVSGGYRGVVGTNVQVDNQAGGVIVGGSYGLDLYGASTLDNAGTIAAGAYADGDVTLGGYDGVRMSGGTVNNLAGGAIMSGAYAGIYSYGAEISITNAGSITSNTGNGLYLRSAVNDVTNLADGVISGGIGVNVGGGLTLDNAGLIKGTNGNAIFVESGAATITNSGSLISTNASYTGVYTNGGGSLTNLAGGTIIGGYDGVRFGGSAVVDNAGSIVNQNPGRIAVLLSGDGTVTNREGGSIAGAFRGVYFGAAGSVANDGTISAVTDNAISFIGDGAVTNSAGGVITSAGRNSGGWGVWGNGTLSVDNAGAIDGESGVVFTGTGGVTNRAGGVIDGRLYGVLAYPQASTGAVSVDNAGTISGGTGVAFAAGGTVVNRAGGEISGDAGYGVQGSAGVERVENAGLISGSLRAVDLGGGADTLVMITGGTLGGIADGGAGVDALVLDGTGAGTLDLGQVINFETQTKQGVGTWTLTGAAQSAGGWSIEGGVLRVSGGQAIADGASVSIVEGATFALDADEAVGALSGEGTVNLGGSTLTLGGDGADSSFDGVIVDGGLVYAGSWRVSDGAPYGSNPAVYSGQEAAALLFGGQASDYAISTVSNDPGQIDYRAWMDGYADTQYLYDPAPQGLHVDADGDGYAAPGGAGTAYSAYVNDNELYVGGDPRINYAFRELSGSLVKTGAGVLTLNGANTFSGSAYVEQGTLRIGGDERLSDRVILWVETDATFDLQGYDEAVREARLKGTLAGTGTLTAGEYQLNGATIEANLGEGVIYTVGGVSTLNGTAGAGEVHVAAGTLSLGDDERLNDDALVAVMADATLDLGGFDETVKRLQLNGTLAGTGTLNAEEYWLLGGTVDADLGEGTLLQFEGDSLLNGLAGADLVELVGGSLTLGASDRFDDGVLVQVDEDATWALDGWDETIDQLWGEGVVDLGEGGSLTLGWDDGSSTFAGAFTGEGTVTKTGDGTFTLAGEHDFDGALVVEGGQVRMAAILAGDLHVAGGLLAGVGEIGGDLKITGGTVSPGGSIGTGPSAVASGADLGVFFTNTLTVSGGTLNFGFAGADLDYASDHIVADGAIHLTGGVMDLHPVSALDQYGFNQQYLLVEGASLTGQFANLNGDFTANAYEGQLFQRLRYDVVPGGVVLEVRRIVDWSEFDPTLQGPVGEALGGTQLEGSDEWAGVLNNLLDLTPEERHAALEDMSGEGVANVTASTLSFGDRFQSVMQGHMNAGSAAGGAGGAGGGTAFAALPFGQGARSDVMGGMLGVAEAGLDNRPGGWAEAFVVDSTLKGRGGAADAGARGGGFATGADFQTSPTWRVGFALGFSDMQGDTTDRSTASEGRFWHAGAYASYSDGPWYGGAAFSRLTGDVDVDRQIGLGPLTLDVAGATSVEATNISINAGRRFMLGEATELRVGVNGTGSKVKQDAYTETGAGGLSLNVAEVERQLFVGEIGARLTRDFDQGRLKPYVGAGAAFAGGDLASLANVGFSGAPTGTGTFVVEGAELPSNWARLEAGVAFKPRENVWLAVGYDGSLAERLQEHRGTVKVSFKW